MGESKQLYIEWSKEHGCYCGEYDDGSFIGSEARIEFDAWLAGQRSRQAEIDELNLKLQQAECRHFWVGKSENQYCSKCGKCD